MALICSGTETPATSEEVGTHWRCWMSTPEGVPCRRNVQRYHKPWNLSRRVSAPVSASVPLTLSSLRHGGAGAPGTGKGGVPCTGAAPLPGRGAPGAQAVPGALNPSNCQRESRDRDAPRLTTASRATSRCAARAGRATGQGLIAGSASQGPPPGRLRFAAAASLAFGREGTDAAARARPGSARPAASGRCGSSPGQRQDDHSCREDHGCGAKRGRRGRAGDIGLRDDRSQITTRRWRGLGDAPRPESLRRASPRPGALTGKGRFHMRRGEGSAHAERSRSEIATRSAGCSSPAETANFFF